MTAPTRGVVAWFPDWPVTAWWRARGTPAEADATVAIVAANQVVACSPAARADGVRRGQRRREAQAACPGLTVVPADPARDLKQFEPLAVGLEKVVSGVQVIRPGLVALRAAGAARYYGDDATAAHRLIDTLTGLGVPDVRIGVADGVFTATQAAYTAQPILVVPPGESGVFLAPLPVTRLEDEELSRLLPQLGVTTLGDFTRLDPAQVRDRFGAYGVHLHTLAAGLDTRPVTPRVPPPELARQIDLEVGLDQVDRIAFAVRGPATDFITALEAAGLVCTEVRVSLRTEEEETVERVWLHPAAFTAPAVVDRVRWQLEAAAGVTITSPVTRIRLEPVAVDDAAHHSPGLFGTGPDERVHHGLTRVQAMLGHSSVVTATIGGGRWLAERQVFTPWGDRTTVVQPGNRPWPGHLPAPLPASVFPIPRPVSVLAAGGSPVTVDARGTVSAAPWLLVDEFGRHRLTGWAGPWPVDERGWDATRHRHACRFQVTDTGGAAWLLFLDDGGSWWSEGRYD